MSDELENKPHEHKYRVESVEKSNTPDGMPEGNWHRYIIARGRSKIEGFRPGSLKTVTQHAETVVEGLNERSFKGSSPYVSRTRK
jgi:hypothetical protein